jgi:hypothetical protein
MPVKHRFIYRRCRADPQVLKAIKHWAKDELRSVNGQIEFILRRALTDAGRMKTDTSDSEEQAG